MPKRRVEDQIDQLNSVRTAPLPDATAALRVALADRTSVVAAKAATLAAELQFRELIPDLTRAFERLFHKPAAVDPQCWGKNAFSKALKDLECRESDPFLRGIRHIQMEPVWGGQEDTATTLRSTCTLALVACDDLPRAAVLRHLVDALNDRAASVRVDAARAMEQIGGEEGALLLRLKARVGDRNTEVVGQALESILRIEGGRAIPFVTEFLDASDEISEEATLALGSSRLPGAIDVLCDLWSKAERYRLRAVVLRSLSISRQDRAIDFVLAVVKTGSTAESRSAVNALRVHEHSHDLRKRLEDALAARADLD